MYHFRFSGSLKVNSRYESSIFRKMVILANHFIAYRHRDADWGVHIFGDDADATLS